MTNIQNKIISSILLKVNPGTTISEDMISKLVEIECFTLPYTDPNERIPSDTEKLEIIAELQTKLQVRMDRGACLKEKNHTPWYYAAKGKISPVFWDRYRTYLFKVSGFNADVVDALDKSTDEMMDLLGNPKSALSFQRRGLVIGDVQSGKTSNYIALMNKAADAGYRIIILLAGSIEKLRQQTQGRVDEGFVGLDSKAFIMDKNSVFVGVGEIDSSKSGWAVTSTKSDFVQKTAMSLSGQLASIDAPVVFVVKKNKSVLEKLEQWLRLYNSNQSSGKIELPMLLIDDEADNASVNTKDNEDPTAINKNIRKILRIFEKCSYVGFTATPYANIFIDPDSTQEMLDDDLFPRDFIYALEAPTNYIGAASVFPDSGRYHYMVKDNSDCESYVPMKHKKDYTPTQMPYSLCEAIASFMIANTIRDLRGQTKKHRTMMVNISIYIDVQKRIANQIGTYVRDMQREIKNYYLTGSRALQYSSFALIKDVFDKYYSKTKLSDKDLDYVSWDDVQKALYAAVAPIVVRYVNGGNAAKNLNYDECDEKEGQDGLRIIAVGGYSLSRGLTLEGLCISYFYRNSKMYDTLMQMGRWFGYRPHYDDLCQVWINPDAVDWYSYISEASDELKREVRRMQAENRTPKDFGLCVRSDKAMLMVTARNKMKTAQEYTLTVSLSGTIVETPFISTDVKIQKANLIATNTLLKDITIAGIEMIPDTSKMAIDKVQYQNVPKQIVLDFISAYKSHSMNSRFHTKEIVDMISATSDGTLDMWDVAIASGSGENKACFGSLEVKCVQRSFAIRPELNAYQMSGSKSRIGNRSYAKAGLTKEEAKAIEDGEHAIQLQIYHEERPLNQDVYFKPDFIERARNPLLVVYPVELKYDSTNDEEVDFEKKAAIEKNKEPLIGISVGIPRIRGKESIQYSYMINIIKYRELMGINEVEEIDETVED